MVDGVGLPPGGISGSVYQSCPTLCRLFDSFSAALAPGLGVEGLPQSATGQATILTGVNAAELAGAHLSGFPNLQLRKLVETENLFAKLQAHGKSCTFANAYARLLEKKLPVSLRSVTTVAAMSALPRLRDRDDLLAGKAVYHDPTRQWLREKGDSGMPIIDEAVAAGHLATITRQFDFCLYEYFLTDHAGHRGNEDDKLRILHSLDRFLGALLEELDYERELLLLVSDHGNIESEDRFHTHNPVPWTAFGKRAETAFREVDSLLRIVPGIVRICTGPA